MTRRSVNNFVCFGVLQNEGLAALPSSAGEGVLGLGESCCGALGEGIVFILLCRLGTLARSCGGFLLTSVFVIDQLILP